MKTKITRGPITEEMQSKRMLPTMHIEMEAENLTDVSILRRMENEMTEKNITCAPMTTLTPNDGLEVHINKQRTLEGKISKITLEGSVTAEASEHELHARWKKLLYAESVLQAQREEILSILDEAERDGEGATPWDMRIERALADQVSRPSPDYRALLINTRCQLEVLHETIGPALVASADPARVALKEAMRLTDVEHLKPWVGSIEALASRAVINELIDGLDRRLFEDADNTWADEMVRDLTDARDKPALYLERQAHERHASTR